MSNPYENLPEGVEGRAFAEFRATDEDGTEIEGHAATFDEPYNVGPFMERIAPGAFDDVLGDDVRALVNHNPDKLLGRTSSGTLEVGVDDTGLMARVDLPDTSDGRDVRELVSRGDLDQMSFGFEVEADSWEDLEDGTEMRTIEKVKRLWDVSPVTFPANPNTDVALRSREAWQETRDAEPEGEAPVETLTVRLDADTSELRAKLKDITDLARRIRSAVYGPGADLDPTDLLEIERVQLDRAENQTARFKVVAIEGDGTVSNTPTSDPDESDETDEADVGELEDRLRKARLDAALEDSGIE